VGFFDVLFSWIVSAMLAGTSLPAPTINGAGTNNMAMVERSQCHSYGVVMSRQGR
jgi:hypothetical protein